MVWAKRQNWKWHPSHRAYHGAAIRISQFKNGCALFQVAVLRHRRIPKDNCHCGNDRSRLTRDLNHWEKEINSPVSCLQQQLPDVTRVAAFTGLFHLTYLQATEQWHWRWGMPAQWGCAGAPQGKSPCLWAWANVQNRQCLADKHRRLWPDGRGANVQSAGKGTVCMANYLLLLITERDVL